MIVMENIKEQINASWHVARLLGVVLKMEPEHDRDKEHFWVIGLNAKNVVRFVDLVSLGTLTNSLIHPREVFRLAVMKGVASIILGHNHPSGDPTPSLNDEHITDRLKKASNIIGIDILDHIIIGSEGKYISLAEKLWKSSVSDGQRKPRKKKDPEPVAQG